MGLSLPDAIKALHSFTGAGRRFEVMGEVNGITVIDDYGHHPTEVGAALEAVRSRYPDARVWAIWQPHTYTRTQMHEKAFVRALDQADRVIVLKIFAAREADTTISAGKHRRFVGAEQSYLHSRTQRCHDLPASIA
ncbi:MAG: glutamate ligase domain-containing protein [Brevefilum sp.]